MISIVMGIALTIAASATPTPSLYQQQHQQEEMTNCLAKHGANYPAHFCDTPTPVATATPVLDPSTPAPTPQSISTSTSDELVPTASETPEPVCWATDPSTGDPDNGYIVFVPYVYPDGSPDMNDDGTQVYGPIPIDDDHGAQLHAPCPTVVPTLLPIPTNVPPSPVPAVRQPQPVAVPVQSSRVPPAPTRAELPAPTETPEPTETPTPTVAPTSTQTPTANPTRTVTPSAVPTPSLATATVSLSPVPVSRTLPPTIPPINVDWRIVGVAMTALATAGAGGYFFYRRERRKHDAQVAEIAG